MFVMCVDDPPDHITRETVFECFSRKSKIEAKKLLPDISDQVFSKHTLIKWKQVSQEERALFKIVAARETVMCKRVKK